MKMILSLKKMIQRELTFRKGNKRTLVLLLLRKPLLCEKPVRRRRTFMILHQMILVTERFAMQFRISGPSFCPLPKVGTSESDLDWGHWRNSAVLACVMPAVDNFLIDITPTWLPISLWQSFNKRKLKQASWSSAAASWKLSRAVTSVVTDHLLFQLSILFPVLRSVIWEQFKLWSKMVNLTAE